jgi:hypothetical protein
MGTSGWSAGSRCSIHTRCTARGSEPSELADLVEDVVERGLGVPDQDCIEEVGDRLRVGGAGATAQDDRVFLVALEGPTWDAGEVEQVRNVDVVELGLERDPDHVEVSKRPVRFERVERQLGRPQRLRHVGHGSERPLRQGVLAAVDQVVENPCALMGHADLVCVRECEGDPNRHRPPGFADQVPLDADVTRRLLHSRQNGVEGRANRLRRR